MSIFTLLALSSVLVTTDPTPQDAAQTAFEAMAADFPAMNAMVLVDGDIVWQAEAGFQRDASDGLDQNYNFYSIAKMLTGMAYARLVAETGLDIDQPVTLIDPALPTAYGSVTLRQLLTHTSGVRHYSSRRDWIRFAERRCETPSDALQHFIGDDLAFEPGTEAQYTTYGFVLLSHLLVQITGEDSYDAAMQSVLGDVYRAQTDREDADKAVNYLNERGEWTVMEAMSAECKFGGGGLIASARDLANMGQALIEGVVIEPAAMERLLLPENQPGLADNPVIFGMIVGYSEELQTHYAFHSGGSPGGRAFLLVLSEPQMVIAMTANSDGENFGSLAFELAGLFSSVAAIEDQAR